MVSLVRGAIFVLLSALVACSASPREVSAGNAAASSGAPPGSNTASPSTTSEPASSSGSPSSTASPGRAPRGDLESAGDILSENARPAGQDDKPPSSVQSSLDKAAIQRVIRSAFADFKACYNEGLTRDPTLTGRINVRFKILVDGHVTDVTEAPSYPDGPKVLADKKVVTCVLTRFEKLVFDKQAASATVTYPIQFNPAP